jgi:glycosyltransferase involved in cell wall biosynthesis
VRERTHRSEEPSSRARILVLTKTTAMGGAERLLMNALPYLDREQFEYRFAALDEHGPLATACREARFPLHVLPRPALLDPRNALALRRWLRRDRIDLVHAHLPLVGALARVAARGLATRLVYTEHNTQECYRPASRWLNAATYGWQQSVVAVSDEVRRSAESLIGARATERTAVIPNGVDFEGLDRDAGRLPEPPLPRLDPGAFLILAPATLAWRKGQDVLLDALASLEERRSSPVRPIAVWLAGDGSERATLLSQIAASGLTESVHMLGSRPDVFALMRLADAVVLPSRHEGHPLALLEALALGRPAIATAVGGVPEIIDHGRTGLLVPPDDAGALATAIERMRCDPALRRRMGVNAAEVIRTHFDVRRSVAAIEGLYRRCLAPALDARAVLHSSLRGTVTSEERSHEAIQSDCADSRTRLSTDGVRGDRGRRGRSIEELRSHQ